jgi:methyl-accepting chemotaxis protein
LAQSIGSLTARLKSYIAYIAESEHVLYEMARGNLKVELKNDYDGEFAKLKVSLLSLADTLKDTIGKIKESSESINMNAEQVSSGAQVLAQGTTEQASAIEELSAEINEIYHTIVNNAEHAVSAGNKAKETASEVQKGNVQMSEMLSAMDEISKTSREINKIIKVIDDIAFQTNILALNAAVEAARAGSAGKGFAVVADEVRNLAGKSAEAAKQTTALIENSISAINKGTALADEAGKSLSGIVNKTNETNELIAEIASASSHQTVSVNQIKSGIEQISSVVQENAASAEASAANSEELSGQSHILNELVSKFNL